MPRSALLAPVALLLACGSEPAPSCGTIGRSSPCACPGGAQGAQECGPGGVFAACVCPDGGALEAGADVAPADAAPDNGADVTTDAGDAGDAGADATSDAPRDAAPFGVCPSGRDGECPAGGVCLGTVCYRICEDAGACAEGEECSARMLPTGQVRVCAPR